MQNTNLRNKLKDLPEQINLLIAQKRIVVGSKNVKMNLKNISLAGTTQSAKQKTRPIITRTTKFYEKPKLIERTQRKIQQELLSLKK